MPSKLTPVATKRRRVEDEVRRPKKKVRNFKKQKNYHSSDDESDDEDGPAQQPRASDAPQRSKDEPKRTLKLSANSATGPNAEVKAVQRPKPILKQPKPLVIAKTTEESSADGREEEDEATDGDLEDNTVSNIVNGLPNADEESDEEDDNDEPGLDGVSDDSGSDDDEDHPSEPEASITSNQAHRSKKKRNDPSAFATSISRILDTKLTTSKRSDPVLSRSKSASEANRSLADSKLEAKARAQIRAEKRAASEKGRVKDVLGLQTPDVDTGKLLEEEKRLKKTAQRGVIHLFNAVRAAQVKAEEAAREARAQGVVGMQKREERVNKMSKHGFLDLISSGGKGKTAVA
ncbi:Ribosomal RNA-processing protein 15 [Fulvia fulva]|uniref:Ribosomal RNA-processing protein 15 n=1 Tax=Passalora fulva TaxID=5499 RepID=A0A9Q8UR21_PASFU|nr:Ribosomal RNA-processing protein 15 [Fulvia fulva]KAK4621424.1 Ribosomal RNA-processing protein 15 [Fulvia fulva]KAK4622572.1 Ribosomal RNA-processing protein 15 [Fulvia fulva]UJO19256.1 Ribosomal RNA-processing protein 15 [Fulvia fulva]WPV16753.1 Ribosomal RNA-processing protein 15 [Fulvia fulva]WPV30721.1 Ribosomal RNA-processing protein 15 [Fulvia fulva]